MNTTFVLAAALLLSGNPHAAQVHEPKKNGPVTTAAHFMAQHYSVDPDAVTVAVVKRVGGKATVITKVAGQQSCTLELAKAPAGVGAEFGWLVAGIDCSNNTASAAS
ncbi:hypothetical protein [Pseudomonas syringae]|uniref:hypothetical protein n=1 Tax=Pseudomonas syringae TaxID=317 RepID=UPI001F2F7E47|nr:hypothetical protein [Pseudomonas syringae]MCF5371971.1 hypothetical protein [Pseudomonas syringae]MCF5382032.1 hypothetical protein [Pseudomonas syringae]MCF5419435.1 hypothetical protein [Pseudomonas syringae]MCF5451981.1 hypothetical protein [Pseudomonas syringae]MCF5460749.1 hypothetical protein [Pseudomonas syringae]